MWQDAVIQHLVSLLQPDEAVQAVAVSGSRALLPTEKDVWSDVDLLVVVSEQAISRYFPALDWLQALGEVYAYEQNANQLTSTTRVCFSDFRRLDIVFTTEFALEQIDSWDSISFWNGTFTLFSRSALVDTILARRFEKPKPAQVPAEEFQAMANRFWFKATLAVTKVVRGDLLIALHLALDLVRDCCVLAMLLRDRAANTNYHRHGGIGIDFVAQLQTAEFSYDAPGILDGIEQSGIAFDGLAAQWSSEYKEHRQPLIAAVNRARQAVRNPKDN
jgi:predicted nucleotidyltransferase